MDLTLNDLLAKVRSDNARLLLSGLAMPADYPVSQFIFEILEAYYQAQQELNQNQEGTLQFIAPPDNSAIRPDGMGEYEITRMYRVSGVIKLGIDGFKPLQQNPPLISA